MTAPVIDSFDENGNPITFVMPKKFKKEDLPDPNSKDIELMNIPGS